MHAFFRWQSGLVVTGLCAALIVGCSGGILPAEVTTTPAPTEEATQAISASGEVVPAEWTALSFSLSGQVTNLPLVVGDQVAQGAIIAELDTAELEAAVLQARAALDKAEADLAELRAGPSEEEIRQAEQAVAAANARTAAAAAQRDALYSAVTDAQIAEAQSQLYQAQIEYEHAREQLTELQEFDPEDCDNYQEWWPDVSEIEDAADDYFEGSALELITEQAQVLENTLFQCPLGAYEAVERYVSLTELGVAAVQTYLDELQRGPTADEVRVEEARIWMASAQAEAARARLDFLKAQPFPEQVAVAEAAIEQAQAEVEAAMAQLKQATLVAPFSGTVTDVMSDENEFVGPGQPVLQLANLDTLYVMTTDLNELDVAFIQVGDPARLTFDALSGIELDGIVRYIPPKAEAGIGVNYAVEIQLDTLPEDLRWGMTAFIDIEVSKQE